MPTPVGQSTDDARSCLALPGLTAHHGVIGLGLAAHVAFIVSVLEKTAAERPGNIFH